MNKEYIELTKNHYAGLSEPKSTEEEFIEMVDDYYQGYCRDGFDDLHAFKAGLMVASDLATGNGQAEYDSVDADTIPTWAQQSYKSTVREKNYTAVVYPDDAPDDWIDILRRYHWTVVVSPLHEFDANPDGTRKKKHYHVLITADGGWIKMSELAELGKEIKGMALPQKAGTSIGLIRYFIHQDNPEKFQYPKRLIRVYGNYDIEKAFELSATAQVHLKKEISQEILNGEIVEYADLVELGINKGDDWYNCISSNTVYFNALVRSVRHRKNPKSIDELGGE